MKNNLSQCLFAIVIMCSALVSCSNEQEQQVSKEDISIISFYFENGRYFDVLAEAETLSPETLKDPKLRIIVAKTYLQIGYPDRSQEILENLKQDHSDLNAIDLLLVESLYKQHKYAQARNLLFSSELQKKHASNPASMLLHAKLELADKNIESSKEILLNIPLDSDEYAHAQVWLARIELLQNRESKAITRIEKILDQGKELVDAWLFLANIKFNNEEYTEAENYYLQALKLDRSKILTQQSLKIAQNIVLSKTAQGNSIAGEEFYRAFLDSYPKSPIYYFEIARLAYSKNDLSKAEESLKSVLSSSKSNPKVVSLLAKILIKQDKLNDADALMQKYIAEGTDDMELVYLKAITDMQTENYQSAIDRLNQFVLERNKFKEVLIPLMAYVHLKNNNKDKFEELLQPYDGKSRDLLAGVNGVRTLYLEIGKLTEAEQFLQTFINNYPSSNELKVLLLKTLNDIGKSENISEKLDQWLAQQSGNTTLRLIRISQAIESGNIAAALKQFNHVDNNNLSNRDEGLLVNNFKNLIVQSHNKDILNEVSQLLVKWQKVLPENLQISLMLADIHISASKYKSAIPLYEAILKKHPNDYVVLNNLAWSYFNVGDNRALNTAEQAFAINPNDAPVCDTLGWILVESGQIAKGLQLLEQALEIAPSNEEIRQHYELAKAKLN